MSTITVIHEHCSHTEELDEVVVNRLIKNGFATIDDTTGTITLPTECDDCNWTNTIDAINDL